MVSVDFTEVLSSLVLASLFTGVFTSVSTIHLSQCSWVTTLVSLPHFCLDGVRTLIVLKIELLLYALFRCYCCFWVGFLPNWYRPKTDDDDFWYRGVLQIINGLRCSNLEVRRRYVHDEGSWCQHPPRYCWCWCIVRIRLCPGSVHQNAIIIILSHCYLFVSLTWLLTHFVTNR